MQEIYVDTVEGAREVCARLRKGRFVALDTEFIRERSYYPRLCLLQLADDELVACIDPLALPDLSAIEELLFDPNVVKVLHAARQDLEIFYHAYGRVPGPLFDTQLAATLLGYGEQVGYAALVKEVLGIDLDKSHARTDWEQRPLEPQQLRYAADDVIHLATVYHRLHGELARRNRLEWLAEDFAQLGRPELYAPAPEHAWERIKGRHKLRGVQLAAMRGLAAWRERQAQSDDIPRKWVISDEPLMDIARLMPEGMDKLARMRGMPKQTVDRYGRSLLAEVAAAKALPKEQWPVITATERITPAQEAIADALMALVRLRGAEHQVSPTAIAARRDIEALLLGDPDTPLLHGWRGALVGEDLRRLVAGEVSLRVREGRLEVV